VKQARLLAAFAALPLAFGCGTAARAVEQPNAPVAPEPSDLWRCVAESAYYDAKKLSQSPFTREISGKFVFHSATPDAEWTTLARIRFADSGLEFRYGDGIMAVVRKREPGTVYLRMIVDGDERLMTSIPYGTPIPFKISFDDEAGTVTAESGGVSMTAQTAHPYRADFDLSCSGADVSFADFVSR
jgi:hypothetical protein